jgi:uncharacterized protein
MLQIITECAAIAFTAGMIFGIFGGGSGLIMMPGYYYLMRHFHLVGSHQMQVAVGTTAFTSGILGAFAAYQQYRTGQLDTTILKKMIPGLLLGTVIAIVLLNIIPSHVLKKAFGFVVMIVAIWLVLYKVENDTKHWSLTTAWNNIRTTCIGLLWFLLGVAVLNVPYLHKCNIDMRKAVCNATVISASFSLLAGTMLMASGSLAVGVSHTHIGYVNVLLCLISIIPSSIAAIIGAKLGLKLPKEKLKICYSALIFTVGALMLFA